MSVRVFLKTKRSNSEEKYRFTHHPPPHLHHRLLPRCPHLRSPLHPAGTKTADANSQCLFRISRKVRVPSWKCVVERSLNSGLPRSESQSRLMYHKLTIKVLLLFTERKLWTFKLCCKSCVFLTDSATRRTLTSLYSWTWEKAWWCFTSDAWMVLLC